MSQYSFARQMYPKTCETDTSPQTANRHITMPRLIILLQLLYKRQPQTHKRLLLKKKNEVFLLQIEDWSTSQGAAAADGERWKAARRFEAAEVLLSSKGQKIRICTIQGVSRNVNSFMGSFTSKTT